MTAHARYINRELSWLEFNQRVLDEVASPATPPLERLKFIAISGSNLDEFFMVRVGGLRQLAAGGSTSTDPSGLSPNQQLDAISERTRKIVGDQYRMLAELEDTLSDEGLSRIRPDRLTDRQARHLDDIFDNEIFGVLTPVALASEEPFPPLAGLDLNVCVRLAAENEDQDERYAFIPFGRNLPRFVTLPAEGGYQYVLLEDAVELLIERFFEGVKVLE